MTKRDEKLFYLPKNFVKNHKLLSKEHNIVLTTNTIV